MANSTKKVASKLNAAVKARNDEFKRMGINQKRIAIAQDVIAALKVNKFTAKSGTYISDVELSDEVRVPLGEDVKFDLSEVVEHIESCDVCAKGAMFLAAVGRFDNLQVTKDEVEGSFGVPLHNFDDDTPLSDHLENYFDRETLDEIEQIFEGNYNEAGRMLEIGEDPDDEAVRWSYFYDQASDNGHGDEGVLIALMKNIIANNGKLVPPTIPGRFLKEHKPADY